MSMDWNHIEIFKGIDLNDSFVLNWSEESDQLQFNLEASIWPESKYYTEPENGEYTCYRKATIMFKCVQSITGLKPMESALSSADLNGTIDFGNIETLSQTENGYHISGDFGSVNIIGGELHFEVHT